MFVAHKSLDTLLSYLSSMDIIDHMDKVTCHVIRKSVSTTLGVVFTHTKSQITDNEKLQTLISAVKTGAMGFQHFYSILDYGTERTSALSDL